MDNRDRKDEQNDLESPLGIAGTPVTPDAPERLRPSDDPDEVKKRRARGVGTDVDASTPGSGMSDVNLDHKGATGIDLGGHERGTK